MTFRISTAALHFKLPLIALLVSLLFPSQLSLATSPQQSEKDRVARLVALCRLWGKVKYFHPALAYRSDIDWDKALVVAVPKVIEARTTKEYRDALQNMLGVLGDPLTTVSGNDDTTTATSYVKNFEYRLTEDQVLVVHAGNYFALYGSASQKALAEINKEIGRARAVVFDLRADTRGGAYGDGALRNSLAPLERMISTLTFTTAGERSRLYYGYETASVFSSGQYHSGFFTQGARRITPLPNAKELPAVFVVNKNSGLLPSMLPLQSNGKALIVFDGGINEGAVGKSEELELTDGLSAQVRVSENIYEDGTSGEVQPDRIVATASDRQDSALETAMTLVRDFKPSSVVRKKLPVSGISMTERSYPEMLYPNREYRLLSAFRIWNTINYFFPYKHLMDRDWDTVLTGMIPKFENAANELEYSLTVAEMVSYLDDSHVYLRGQALDDYFGLSYPPVRVRMIENEPVISAITSVESAKLAGVEVGDVVLKVDGEDAKDRLHRFAKYISAATPQSKMFKAALTFMNGKDGTTVTLTVRDRLNRTKEVKLPRKFEDYTTLYNKERSGDILKLLPGNIGYADLDRLELDRMDEMLELFKNTHGIIFDLRGYPKGIFYWLLTPRLTEKQNVPAALLETPLVGQNTSTRSAQAIYQMIQPKPEGKSIYKGTTVLLVDERSVSQAEHTGLFFKAANGTKIIGGPSAGTNGEITTMTAPGGITIGFTGQSVRYPDGKQLQRIGLVPDLLVQPTIKGLRTGVDEVLEGAIRYLKSPRRVRN